MTDDEYNTLHFLLDKLRSIAPCHGGDCVILDSVCPLLEYTFSSCDGSCAISDVEMAMDMLEE